MLEFLGEHVEEVAEELADVGVVVEGVDVEFEERVVDGVAVEDELHEGVEVVEALGDEEGTDALYFHLVARRR